MDINVNKMTIIELNELKTKISASLKERNAEVREAKKEAKETEKEVATETGMALAKIDEIVSFNLKDEVTRGRIIKIGKTTISCVVVDENDNDVVDEKGKPRKIWRYFYQIY